MTNSYREKIDSPFEKWRDNVGEWSIFNVDI